MTSGSSLKRAASEVPLLGRAASWIWAKLLARRFAGSRDYWIRRYAGGGRSGAGSYGAWADFKARFLNEFVSRHQVETVVEYGCGDGNQLRAARYPRYLGFDVSPAAVNRCRELFRGDETKRFELLQDYAGEEADLALSLDVIYHLVEDDIFREHMETLFSSARHFVIIFSSDTDRQEESQHPHVRHRRFTRWTDDSLNDWEQVRDLPGRQAAGPAGSDEWRPFFTVYRRR